MSFKLTTGGTNKIKLVSGSMSTPAYSFTNDTDTGFYRVDEGEFYLRNAKTAFQAHLQKYDIEESFLRDMKDLFPEEFI